MASRSFSLTEQFVIHPALMLRAQKPKDTPQLAHFFESEIQARVIALSTSFFAALDLAAHLSSAAGKTISLSFRKLCHISERSNTYDEIITHLSRAALFAQLALIGSIAGAIFPDFLRSYLYTPDLSTTIPEFFQDLLRDVIEEKIKAPFEELKTLWNDFTLEQKHYFTLAFAQSRPEVLATVRDELKETVYRNVSSLEGRVRWLSQHEVNVQAKVIEDVARRAFYFHATSEAALKSILSSRKVEVRHEKTFKGAFVSTVPETMFGDCVIAFNRSIERLSPLEHGFTLHTKFWAGFSQNIPATESTIECIYYAGDEAGKRKTLEKELLELAGRAIPVISIREGLKTLEKVHTLSLGIPKEWQTDSAIKEAFGGILPPPPGELLHKGEIPRVKRRSYANVVNGVESPVKEAYS